MSAFNKCLHLLQKEVLPKQNSKVAVIDGITLEKKNKFGVKRSLPASTRQRKTPFFF